jgi:hypothetical protein
MARVIPNEQTWVGFLTTVADDDLVPTPTEIEGGVDLTGYVLAIEATTRGNQIPTPTFESLFETTISGTVSSTFTAEFYRDDEADTAWDTLPRGTDGYFVISRYGGSDANSTMPIAGDEVEVWPVRITSRSSVGLSNNEVQRVQIECSVTRVPNEAAIVAV